MWFQKDLPNPAVDLSKLGFAIPKDWVPFEFENYLDKFKDWWIFRINQNFDNLNDNSYVEGWFFLEIQFIDQFKQLHYPMAFLSKISSPRPNV